MHEGGKVENQGEGLRVNLDGTKTWASLFTSTHYTSGADLSRPIVVADAQHGVKVPTLHLIQENLACLFQSKLGLCPKRPGPMQPRFDLQMKVSRNKISCPCTLRC